MSLAVNSIFLVCIVLAESLVNQQLMMYSVALLILLSSIVIIIIIQHVIVVKIFLQSSVVSLKHNTSLSKYSILNHKVQHCVKSSLDPTSIWNNPHSGMWRLQDGPYAGVGRVEVYCITNGVLYVSGFDHNAANIVCIQLDYTNADSISATA